eukprot:263679-Hanusia_phi.AAC.1
MRTGKSGAPAGLYDPSKLTAAARTRIASTRERASSLKSGLSFSSFPKDDLFPKKKEAEEPAVGEKYTFCKTQVFPDERWKERPGHHAPPENELELEWVYGYHGHDGYAWLHNDYSPETRMAPSRNNLFFVANEGGAVDGRRIAYFTSSIGVVMDVQLRKQRFFNFHDGEICSMTVNPRKTLVATGQVSSHGSMNPCVAVWSPAKVFNSSSSCKPEAVMSGFCEFRIVALSFSADGEYIMCIGDDELHRFACYRWRDDPPSVLFKGQVGKATMLTMTATACGFAACGNKEVKVWEHPMLNSQFSKDVEGVRWLVGVKPMEESLIECIAAIPDPDSACGTSLVCGWPDGHLCFFQQKEKSGDWNLEFAGNQSENIAQGRGSRYWMGHAGSAVKCVSYFAPDPLALSLGCDKGLLVSSDVRGMICGWRVDPGKPIQRGKTKRKMLEDFAWDKVFEVDLTSMKAGLVAKGWRKNRNNSSVDVSPVPLNPNVLLPLYASRLDYDGRGTLLVGLSNNKIVQISLEAVVRGEKVLPHVLVEGHTGFLKAVASLPTSSLYFNLGIKMFGQVDNP